MSIEFNEDLLAIWFIDVSDTSNWLCALYKTPTGTRLTYRMRYYEKGSDPFSVDKRNWYAADSRLPPEEGIASAHKVYVELIQHAHGGYWELIRGARTVEEFFADFRKLPFVHGGPEWKPDPNWKRDPTKAT